MPGEGDIEALLIGNEAQLSRHCAADDCVKDEHEVLTSLKGIYSDDSDIANVASDTKGLLRCHLHSSLILVHLAKVWSDEADVAWADVGIQEQTLDEVERDDNVVQIETRICQRATADSSWYIKEDVGGRDVMLVVEANVLEPRLSVRTLADVCARRVQEK